MLLSPQIITRRHKVPANGTPTWTYVGSASASSGSFGSVTVGSGILVVAVHEKSSPQAIATGVSFNGTNLTVAAAAAASTPSPSIWYGSVSGATGSIVVTVSGSAVYSCAIAYGLITGATVTPTSAVVLGAGATTTPNMTISVPANGVAITLIGSDRGVTGTWSGSTSDTLIALPSTEDLLLAHSTTTGSINPKFTGTSAIYSGMAAAWGP